MIQQIEFTLGGRRRGCHLITADIVRHLPALPETGMLNIFVKHTSCGLTINENADPDVRTDLAAILDHLVPERASYYTHTMEGPDDMPAHAKATLTSASLTIPITNGRLNLGRWQGIYFCEFRNYGGDRQIVLTVYC